MLQYARSDDLIIDTDEVPKLVGWVESKEAKSGGQMPTLNLRVAKLDNMAKLRRDLDLPRRKVRPSQEPTLCRLKRSQFYGKHERWILLRRMSIYELTCIFHPSQSW